MQQSLLDKAAELGINFNESNQRERLVLGYTNGLNACKLKLDSLDKARIEKSLYDIEEEIKLNKTIKDSFGDGVEYLNNIGYDTYRYSRKFYQLDYYKDWHLADKCKYDEKSHNYQTVIDRLKDLKEMEEINSNTLESISTIEKNIQAYQYKLDNIEYMLNSILEGLIVANERGAYNKSTTKSSENYTVNLRERKPEKPSRNSSRGSYKQNSSSNISVNNTIISSTNVNNSEYNHHRHDNDYYRNDSY